MPEKTRGMARDSKYNPCKIVYVLEWMVEYYY